jgi:CPA2 family monovalent cation:H+ antiporter-2
MLIDPVGALGIWHWALAGAIALLGIKTALVAAIVRLAGIDAVTAWRTALTLAVGGEFGFALIAIALGADVVDARVGQIALASVLLSMLLAPFLIRHSHALALRLAPRKPEPDDAASLTFPNEGALLSRHVIICGYGRIGQSVGHMLEEEKIPYVALDLDPARVKQARIAGERVFYADSTEPGILQAVGLATARLVVVSHDDVAAALRLLEHVRAERPDLPVMVRTRDEAPVQALRSAGATEVVPETLEAGLMIATHAMLLLDVPTERVVMRLEAQRSSRYRLLRTLGSSRDVFEGRRAEHGADRLKPVIVPAEGSVVGRSLKDVSLPGIVVTALVRRGNRLLSPPPETRLEAGDALVLFGSPEEIDHAEQVLWS